MSLEKTASIVLDADILEGTRKPEISHPAVVLTARKRRNNMPVYDYECTECKHVQEETHPMKDMPQETKCEKCGKKAVRVFLKAPNLIIPADFFSHDGGY